MTKRSFFALLLALLLCVSAGAAFAEDRVIFAEPRYDDMTPEEIEAVEYFYIQATASDGQAVYILLSRDESMEIYRYTPGDEEPTLLSQQPYNYYDISNEDEMQDLPEEDLAIVSNNPDQLISGNGAAYALNLYTSRLGQLTDAGIEWQEEALELPEMMVRERDYSYTREVVTAYVQDGLLYLALRADDWETCDLYTIDIATGAAKDHWNFPVYSVLAPYKDGLLLSLTMEERSGDTNLVSIDPESGKEEVLLAQVGTDYQMPSNLLYDEADDSILFTMSSQVYRMQAQGTPEIVAYLSAVDSGSRGSYLLGNHYVLQTYEGIFIRDLSRGVAEYKPIRIAGGWITNAIRKYSDAHPETPVLSINRYFETGQDVADVIMSGEGELDIFAMSVEYGSFGALKQKGYMADLSGNADIAQAVARMYPEFARHLMNDQGQIIAIPYEIYVDSWSVDMTLWEESYPGQDLPRTWDEWLDLYIEWQDTHDREDEYGFFRNYDEKYNLLYSIYNSYIRLCEREGTELNFEAPVFRELLEKLEQVEFYEPDWENMSEADQEELSEYANSPCIFNYYGSDVFSDPDAEQFSWDETTENHYSQFYPMPTFSDGEDPLIPYNMQVLFVNPNSTNQEAAIDLLAAQLEGLENRYQYMIYADQTEPLPNSYYASNLKSQENYLQELKDSLEKAEPEEKRSLEEEIGNQERYLEFYERTGQWDLTEGGIRFYQEQIAPYLYVNENSLFRNYDGEDSSGQILNNIFYRYLEGQANLDEMLKELTQKTRMMEREAQ